MKPPRHNMVEGIVILLACVIAFLIMQLPDLPKPPHGN